MQEYRWHILSLIVLGCLLGIILIILTTPTYGSSEWLAGVEICTDIWQSTHNETLYYDCMNPLEKAYGAETNDVQQYVKEIKFQTCHVNFDIYNLSSYYRCIGI